MIQMNFPEPITQEWSEWKLLATSAANSLIEDHAKGIKPEISKDLYTQMKAILFSASFGKCVYCETKIVDIDPQGKLTPLDQPGDVEHYRPKGKVTDENDEEVMILGPDGKLMAHPGYFWLAYDWKNLFLACRTCNAPYKDRETGRRYGKSTRFPLKNPTSRAANPGEEEKEQPLFLHPFFQNPEEHFEFIPLTGELVGTTEEGKICIDLLNLNRPGLAEQRKDVYESVVARINKADGAALDNAIARLMEHLQYLTDYEAGKKAYALAGKKALKDSAAKLEPVYKLLKKYF